jgi:hypothetical protein
MRNISTLALHRDPSRSDGVHHFEEKRTIKSMMLQSAVFLLLLLTVLTSTNQVVAQCTAKDVKIQRAYLANFDGDAITACGQDAYVWIEMYTQAPRQGALVQGTIEILNPDKTIASSSDFSYCYVGPLSTGTHFRIQKVNWDCGKLAVLTKVHIAWNTGQTPFCSQTTDVPVPGTSSKCNNQVGDDQFIVIEIPDLNPAFSTTEGTCTGNDRTINFSATVTGGSGLGYTYSWDFGDGTSDGPNTVNTTSHSFASGSSYLVTLTATDLSPDVSPKVFQQTVNVTSCCTPPSISAELINSVSTLTDSKTYGNSSTTVLSVVASGDGLHYQWEQSSDGLAWFPISGTDNASFTVPVTNAGTYYYHVIVTGNCGTVIDGTAAISNTFTVIINPATLTITATDKHKTYGTALTSPVTGSTPTDFTVSGLQNSETVGSVTINYGTGSLATAAVATYNDQVTPSGATGGTFTAGNYSIGYVKGAIIVDAATLTITATDKHKTYGTALTSPVTGSTPTDFTVSGLQNSETVGSVTINYGTGSLATAAVATYNDQVTPSGATGGTFTAGNYSIGYVKGAIIVDAVQICPDYSGLMFVNTNSNGVYTPGKIKLTVFLATPPSSGTITSSDPTVKFYNTTTGHQLIGVGTYSAPTLANPYPSWSVDWTVPNPATSSSNSTTYTISWEVTGNFSNANCDDNNTLITFAPPASDFTTGGGFIWNKNSIGIFGQKNTNGSTVSTKNNFGFNVKWNKNFSNLQGDFNTIVRMGGNLYQVKSNKPSYLNVVSGVPYTTSAGKTITPYKAYVVYSNAVIKALTSAGCTLVPGCSVGNGTIDLIIVDNGEPGSASSPKPDQIGFTIRDQYNKFYYATDAYNMTNTASAGSPSNQYYVREANLTDLAAGNIQVHLNGAVAPAGTVREGQTSTSSTLAQAFQVTATPNPSFSYFSLNITGNNGSGLVNVKVTDVLGREVESRQNLATGQTLHIGSNYKPGVYIVQVMQGDTVKQLKLVKQ